MSFFFFNDTATTEIYTLSLHDALPIWRFLAVHLVEVRLVIECVVLRRAPRLEKIDDALRLRLGDRKSTRLNSSHSQISYADFCLKKKLHVHLSAVGFVVVPAYRQYHHT